jgi:hypothetical protein
MKPIGYFSFLCIFLLSILSNSVFSQNCGSHQHYDEYIHEEVKMGRLTPEEGHKLLNPPNNSLNVRSSTIRIYVVYDLATTTTAMTLAGAATILNNSAGATAGCEIIFQQVNSSRVDFNFTNTNDGPTMLSDLVTTANAQGWYSNADIVVGFTSRNMEAGGNTGVAGYAYIGFCTTSNRGRAVVIEASTYNALFAHELGHTIGLNHDDTDNSIADHTKSVMNSTVYSNANTMSTTNKSCHRTSSGCTLPVELMAFSGRFQQNKNVLNWTTASEKNNKGFYIERSYDANHWLSMGYVKGAGNSSVKQTYQHEDESPLSLTYYRLRQVDFDGTETYSRMVSIKSDKASKVVMYPNPIKNELVIAFENEVYAEEVNIYDMLGRLISSNKKPSSRLEVNMQNAQTGMYIVEINAEGKRIREKILKIN